MAASPNAWASTLWRAEETRSTSSRTVRESPVTMMVSAATIHNTAIKATPRVVALRWAGLWMALMAYCLQTRHRQSQRQWRLREWDAKARPDWATDLRHRAAQASLGPAGLRARSTPTPTAEHPCLYPDTAVKTPLRPAPKHAPPPASSRGVARRLTTAGNE